jgi:hypothetical protein
VVALGDDGNGAGHGEGFGKHASNPLACTRNDGDAVGEGGTYNAFQIGLLLKAHDGVCLVLRT